jgi:uncharacterized protein YjiS (DUF1127 family)
MESEMPKPQDIDFARLDYRSLSNAQRALVLRMAMERAHAERSEVAWRMMAALATGFRRIAQLVARWHREYLWRRRRRSDAAVLYAFSDHMLKDIGVARCEIDRLVATGRHAA